MASQNTTNFNSNGRWTMWMSQVLLPIALAAIATFITVQTTIAVLADDLEETAYAVAAIKMRVDSHIIEHPSFDLDKRITIHDFRLNKLEERK